MKTGATAVVAAAAGCRAPNGRWRALGDEEARTLAAACDQIVPADEDPGASQAGAVAFIDKQLATRQKQDLGFWRAGIAGLEATARRRHGASFADLPSEAQRALLQSVEKGEGETADWGGTAPAEFFRRLRQYTMMGFYGDPRHGGNRNRVAWAMVGMPDPPVRGRLHETPPPPALAPRPSAAAPGAVAPPAPAAAAPRAPATRKG